MEIFDAIRQNSWKILRSSTDIARMDKRKALAVLTPKLEKYISNRTSDNKKSAGSDFPEDQLIGLNLMFNVVNYCFQHPNTGRQYVYAGKDGIEYRRSTGLNTAMAQSGIDWNDLLRVSNLTNEEWTEMVQLDGNNLLFEGEERHGRLVDFARLLRSCGFHTVRDFIEESGYNAEILVRNLEDTGFFSDPYFLKRAQLATHTIHNNLLRKSGREIRYVDHLTVMADYRIPQVLYNLNIVQLGMNVTHSLLSRKQIRPFSLEEKTLRATAVAVGTILSEVTQVSEAVIDNFLWNLSQGMINDGQMKTPAMLVPTNAY